MTELEIMQRAKMYMDKLANGINPLDDTPVPDGDLLNNVRLCRCFFYISGVLQKVIENGGTVNRAASGPKVPFSITLEQLDTFPLSSKPISVSEIARRINELVPEVQNNTMSKFKYSSITSFLIEGGCLTEVENAAGQKRKRPTETGNALGISTEDRVSPDGYSYTVVMYNRNAQSFLLDNMDAILVIDSRAKAAKK